MRRRQLASLTRLTWLLSARNDGLLPVIDTVSDNFEKCPRNLPIGWAQHPVLPRADNPEKTDI
jgi:hypothetical protein